MLVVQKFGGSSISSTEKIIKVANRIAESYNEGNKVVVILSAQGDTTNNLIEKAKKINVDLPKRELDMLMSTGEQQSAALMSMAIKGLGIGAVSLNAYQAGIETCESYGNAKIKNINCTRIQKELLNNNIIIITGFQGVNKHYDITTLGRGGSDTTAVAISAALNADLCEIYTDVEGVYSADPNIIKSAIKLDVINYDEMLELATLGAKVLHNRSVELAKKYKINLVVRSSLNDKEGTLVGGKYNGDYNS
jgi:aspartate kinase